ncbi:hypothetical protein [Halalkalibacter lacteus]
MSITKRTMYYAHLFEKMGLLTEQQKDELVKSLSTTSKNNQ